MWRCTTDARLFGQCRVHASLTCRPRPGSDGSRCWRVVSVQALQQQSSAPLQPVASPVSAAAAAPPPSPAAAGAHDPASGTPVTTAATETGGGHGSPQHDLPLAPQQVTSLIRHSSTLQQLLATCQQHLQQLNEVHVATALLQTARLAGRQQQQYATSSTGSSSSSSSSASSGAVQAAAARAENSNSSSSSSGTPPPTFQQQQLQQLLELLLPAAVQLLPAFGQRTVSNVLYACAQLGVYHPLLVDGCCQLAFQCANELTPQHLSTILWSLAQLGCAPAEPLLRRLLHNAFSRGREFNPQDLAMLLSALPTAAAPRVRRTQQLSALAFELLPAASPGQLAQFAAGLARLGAPVEAAWWERFWGVSTRQLQYMTSKELSMLSWGLGRLGGRAPQQWQQAYFAALDAAGMLTASASNTSSTSSSSRKGGDGSSHTSRDGNSSSSSSGEEGDPPHLVQAALHLYGASHLCGPPLPPTFMQQWFAATQLQEPSSSTSSSSSSSGQRCSLQLLSALLVAVARCAVMPPAAWLSPVLHQVAAAAPSCSKPQHLVLGCWALASCRVRPSSAWVHTVLSSLQPLLPALQPVDVAQLLWCFARWQHGPGSTQQQQQQQEQEQQQVLLGSLWPVADQLLQRGRPLDIAVAVAAVAAMQQQGGRGFDPPPGWVDRVVKAAGRGYPEPPRWQQWEEGQRLQQQLQRQVQLLQQQQEQLRSAIAAAAAASAAPGIQPPQHQQHQQQQGELQLQLERVDSELAQLRAQLVAEGAGGSQPAAPSSSSSSRPRPAGRQRRQRTTTRLAVAAVPLDGRSWSGWTAPQLAWLAGSAAQLRVAVGWGWKESLLAAALQQGRGMSPQAVAQLVWALGRLGYRGASPHWVPQLLAASGHPPSSFSPRHLVTLVTGCRLLRAAPSADWLLQLLEWTQPRLSALGAMGTLQLLRFHVALSVVPPPAWAAAADAALQGHLAAYPPTELLQALRAVAQLQLIPSSPLLAAAEAAVAAAAEAAGAADAATMEGASHQDQDQQQQQQPQATAGGFLGTPLKEVKEALQHLQEAAAAGAYPRRPRKLLLARKQRLWGVAQGRQPTPGQLVPRLAKQQQTLRRLGRIKRLGGRGSSRRHGVGWLRARAEAEAAAAEAAAAAGRAEVDNRSVGVLHQGTAGLPSTASNGAHAAACLAELSVARSQP